MALKYFKINHDNDTNPGPKLNLEKLFFVTGISAISPLTITVKYVSSKFL